MKKVLILAALAFALTGVANANAAAVYISVPVGALPAGTLGEQYTYKLVTSGGTAPYTLTLRGGTLPQGLTLSADGTISGKIESGGTEFTVNILDATGYLAASEGIIIPVNAEGSAKVLGQVSFPNGSLVNDSGTVHVIYRNIKVPFANADSFVSLGYKWGNIVKSTTATLATARLTVESGTAAHPWGSWVISGKTVYFVSDTGLIPVPTYSIFLNNGGDPKYLVPANANDLNSPMLELMAMNDARLK